MSILEVDNYITNNVVVSNKLKNNLDILNNVVRLISEKELSSENERLNDLVKNNKKLGLLLNKIINDSKDISKIGGKGEKVIINMYCNINNINIFDHINFSDSGIILDDAFKTYLNEIGKIRLLSKTEELELIKRAQNGDKKARNKVIKHNLRFVVFIVKRYANKGIKLADLVAEGNFGLYPAIENYDPSKGEFSTYASYWIRQVALGYFPKDRLIKVPADVNNDYKKIEKYENYKLMEYNKKASEEEIASLVNRTPDRVREIKKAFSDIKSINQRLADDSDSTLSDFLIDDNCILPEEKNVNDMLKDYILENLEILSDEEKRVVLLRHPLDGSEDLSLEEIGKLFNVSRDSIRSIENKAYRKLRNKNKLRQLANDYIPDLNLQPYVKKKKITF